ncbi:hypothetical protein BDV25DRAFT_141595 [Aspergillus avenaceus]|uniref:BZIP domain-containing protein n=1 Tax=Aspergillus avenaceus TaxID=36643 RepID=A0A5N6TQJ6_ASPAV|nr:hypothetical protein BDV25DRAFT_141595 [Aspergillus avenaceus]
MESFTGQNAHLRSRPSVELGYDERVTGVQWGPTVQYPQTFPSHILDANGQLEPSISVARSLEPLSLSPSLSISPPTVTACLKPSSTSPVGTAHNLQVPYNESRRQTQNRAAQRRFRERREQERLQARAQLEELRTENDRLTEQFELNRDKGKRLEEENERLKSELHVLRKRWQAALRLMSDMVQQDDRAAGLLSPTTDPSSSSASSPSSSISPSASACALQRDMQSLRSSVMMQTLVSLFDERETGLAYSRGVSESLSSDSSN